MIRLFGFRDGIAGAVLMASGLIALGSGPAAAQDVTDWQRLMTRDAILVSQAIGWSLEGPVSAREAAPVAFDPGVAPKPIAIGSMFTNNVLLIDYATPPEARNVRGLVGVIELADRADRRVLARFETVYQIEGSTYRVNAIETHEFYPDTPRVDLYFVPAGASIASRSPYAMLDAIRRNAIDPVATVDAAPRQYRVYLVGMDRLSPQADLGFTAVDATTGRAIGKSQSIRQDGWIVASLPVNFAVNGKNGVYFPIVYRPDGTAASQRILMVASNRSERGAPVAAAAPATGATALAGAAPLPPAPTLSPIGQAFMAKGLVNQAAQP